MTTSLPYGPALTAVLTPLRRAFLVLNRWVTAPLLRTTGRTSGLVREAPLGYAVIDGRIVVIAGYGRDAHWFRNALAHPDVEVMLPGALLAGRAEELTDPDARRDAFRTLVASMGVVGRLTLGDVAGLGDVEGDALAEAFPMLAITPSAVHPGPFDPGGTGVRVTTAVWAALGAAALATSVARARTHAHRDVS